MISRLDKRFRVNIKGKIVEIVREQYLRSDIPCRSKLCDDNCENCVNDAQPGGISRVGTLPTQEETSHYLMPFPEVALNYFEILQCPEITGIIFPMTLVQMIQNEGGRQLYSKLCNLLKDRRKSSVMFPNEFCAECFSQRSEDETLTSWRYRNCYSTAMWYYYHLNQRMPIVIVTENEEMKTKYERETLGIVILDLGTYLKTFWPKLTSALDIYESLSVMLAFKEIDSTSEYVQYLPADILDSGLRSGKYLQGQLKVSKYHSKEEAFVIFQDVEKGLVSKRDVLISGMKDRNRAMHGDVVVAELLPRSAWKSRAKILKDNESDNNVTDLSDIRNSSNNNVLPTGRIIGVLQRRWRDYVASFPQQEEIGNSRSQDRVLVIPYDYRIPRIRILTRQASNLQNYRIVVRIDSWEVNSQYPNGHFVRTLGKIGEIQTETATLLVENGIEQSSFSTGVLSEMPINTVDSPWTMDLTEVDRRKDLRNSHLICSIDPKGCEDVDDALSARSLPNGYIEIGVHIADVTYFVPFNSLTDQEAQTRGTTIYMANERLDMLPAVLSSDLCSLLGNVDRYAVSILWTLDENYNIVDSWFGRTVIRSDFKLSYETAQAIVNGTLVEDCIGEFIPELQNCSKDDIEGRIMHLRRSISIMNTVAHVLKYKRLKCGALELESTEVRFEFQQMKEGQVESILLKKELEVHETVAELMIFANTTVAKKIYQSFPTQALLRRHPPPRPDQFDMLNQMAEANGFHMDTSSNKALADSLNRCVDPEDPYVNKLMRMMTVHAMNQASYFSTGSFVPDVYVHYGLAVELYTHFTSPIRRYADIIVHRLLLASLNRKDMEAVLSCQDLQELCDHINDRHLAAKHAQLSSQEMFQALYFLPMPEDDSRRIADAIIFTIRANGLLVFLPEYGIKCPVYLRNNKTQQVAFVSDTKKVEWTTGVIIQEKLFITVRTPLGEQIYRLFDHITVRIDVEQSHSHAASIKLDLINNQPHPDWNKEIFDADSTKKYIVENVIDKASAPHSTPVEKIPDIIAKQSELYNLLENLREMSLRETGSS